MLRQKPLFDSLAPGAIDDLVPATDVRDYAAGETIVYQGQPDEGFYLLQTGSVTLSVRDGEGRLRDIEHLKEDDFFGELALLGNEPSPISAVATTDVHLLIIESGMITQLIEKNPQLAMDMNFFVEKRQAILDAIPGAQQGRNQQSVQHDLVDVVKKV